MKRRKTGRRTGCLFAVLLFLVLAVAAGSLFGYLYMSGAEPSFNHVIGHHIRQDMEETAAGLPAIEQGWYYEQMDSDDRIVFFSG